MKTERDQTEAQKEGIEGNINRREKIKIQRNASYIKDKVKN